MLMESAGGLQNKELEKAIAAFGRNAQVAATIAAARASVPAPVAETPAPASEAERYAHCPQRLSV
jgi:hypothetical protein